MIFAISETSVAWAIAAFVIVGWSAYAVINLMLGRREVGAELELAANRRELPDDEFFEGPRLERFQIWGLVLLIITGVALPVYWLLEPGRQSGAVVGFDERAISRGQGLYETGFQCVNCHGPGGVGGSTLQIIEVPVLGDDGEATFDDEGLVTTRLEVSWEVLSLNDVFYRFDSEFVPANEPDLQEVIRDADSIRNVVIFGRPNTPMPAWGLDGGGPGNEQQIQDVVAYLWSLQSPIEAEAAAKASAGAPDTDDRHELGEYLFANNCARCHTLHASATHEALEPGPPGGGAFGPNLSHDSLERQFPDQEEQVEFISNGSQANSGYGTRGIGSGRMPGFGLLLTERELDAIVYYERSLGGGERLS